MKFFVFKPSLSRQLVFSFLTVLCVLFFSVSIASAALTTINTNNNSNLEWANVIAFQEDPTGDLNPEANASCNDGNNTVDLVKTFVASGPVGGTPTSLYFMAQMAGANALSGQNHAISAYIDCSGNFDHTDITNSNAIYVPNSSNGELVVSGDGDWQNPSNWAFVGGDLGERPGNALMNVEWQIDFDTIASNPSGYNCTANSVARIAFTVAKLDSSFAYICTYDVTSDAAFNVPTLLEMKSLQSRNFPDKPILTVIASIFMVAALTIGLILYFSFRKQTKGTG